MNPDVSSSEFRERFIREVELTSRLSHPHIVPILAADECLFVPDGPDGLCYYVMPYIEGESLRARLEREQRLPLERSEEHTSELQSHSDLVCRLLLEKKKKNKKHRTRE